MAPHPGLHVCCPACEGPIPDLLGELTDEPAGITRGIRAIDCYYCGTPLIFLGYGSVTVGPADPPPARRTAVKRDLKFEDFTFGQATGVDAWRLATEQTLQEEANDPQRDPLEPAIERTELINRFGRRAFEEYPWA
jgi:hypothetical protein